MRRVRLAPLPFLAALLTLILPSAASAENIVEAARQWTGRVEDEKLEKAKPAGGVIHDKDAFAKLWKAWRGREEVPAIDFRKNLVFVSTLDMEIRGAAAELSDGGNLKPFVAATEKQIKGFAYVIAVFPRQGVRSVNGKPLAAE